MNALALPFVDPIVDDPHVTVNDRVSFCDFDGIRVVFVDGNLLYRYPLGDREQEAFLLGTLAYSGVAGPTDLSAAFGVNRTTVYRHRLRIEADGPRGALHKKRGPKGPHTVTAAVRRRVLALKEKGLSNRAVGRKLGISERSIRRALRGMGYEPPADPALPGFEDPKVEIEPSDAAVTVEPRVDARVVEPGPARAVAEAVPPRLAERALARFGRLLHAAVEPEDGENLRCAGVLLALPAILDLGVLDAAKAVYHRLRPGFYGLRSFMLTLLFMALLRIKRPEGLKGLPPEVLGRHLGLDRSPEVKTVRRKLSEIARRGKSHAFLAEIARRLASDHKDLMGFLYVDGHVRAYHGKRPRDKTFVARTRICMPATTDYWVNDAGGEPLFFVTREGHGGLAKVLPDLLAEVKELVGKERRATVVFDRGGWKIEGFRKIRDEIGFDFITYRRKPFEDLPESAFSTYTVKEEGETVEYELADRWVELGRAGRVRLVVLKDQKTGDQIHILTSRADLTAVEVVKRMVARWGQENFFKYMREEYALDAMVSYELAPADADRLVVNPKRRAMEKEIRRQRGLVKKLEHQLSAKSAEDEGRPTLSCFKSALLELGADLADAKDKLRGLCERRSTLQKHVRLREAMESEPTRLEFERKTFTDTLKMIAYRAESALATAIAPHYRRAGQEARKLVCEALRASGDICITDHEMRVTLEPLSSPHRTAVFSQVCNIMSAMNAK